MVSKISVVEEDFDDGDASPELVAEDSDVDAEEEIREKRRSTKKVLNITYISLSIYLLGKPLGANAVDSRRAVRSPLVAPSPLAVPSQQLPHLPLPPPPPSPLR